MTAALLSPADLWTDIAAVRERAPLVHCITNLVVANFNANALLAVGASPVMAHAPEEVADMTAIAQALVVNIGTPDALWAQGMTRAMQAAAARGQPIVLDPVGAGATPYRNRLLAQLLDTALPTVIRGNGSEILSLAGTGASTRGVDSSASADDALDAARQLARRTGGTVCVSGATDHVFDAGGRWARLRNGHPWMSRITGTGCSASVLVGAFCGVQPDDWRATTAAMALLGVAGEIAAEASLNAGEGVGRMQWRLLDALQLVEREEFLRRVQLSLD